MSIPVAQVGTKRKRSKNVFSLKSLVQKGVLIDSNGPFRDSIHLFLRECCVRQGLLKGMEVWLALLKLPNSVVVPLYTVEEQAKHEHPFCNQCRSCGWSWSYNFVCQRSFHLIIPDDNDWNKPLSDDVLYLQTHRLHGLIHGNGYGHLLCISGMEGGSKHLRGREIMDLWDGICSNLHARVITVEDASNKRCMDLRLLYTIAYGHSWFGKWKYKVSLMTDVDYMEAIDILRDMLLNDIFSDLRDTDQCSVVKNIVSFYNSLSECDLTRLKDLFYFMLTLKNSCCIAQRRLSALNAPSPPDDVIISPPRKKLVVKDVSEHTTFNTLIKSLDSSRYPAKRLTEAANAIVEALKAYKADNKYRTMARQDVKNAARESIGDTGLLDNVLKVIDNICVGTHVVHRVKNGKLFEFFIDEVGDGSRRDEVIQGDIPIDEVGDGSRRDEVVQGDIPIVPGADLQADVAFLYSNVLLSYSATKLVLDTKHFVKKWPFEDETGVLKLKLQIVASFNELDVESPPSEIIVLPIYATLMDLKKEAEKVFRDTYIVMENFVLTGIENMDEQADEDMLFGAVESGALLRARFGVKYQRNYEGETSAVDVNGDFSFECESSAVSQARVDGVTDEGESGAAVIHERVELNYEGERDQWNVGAQCEDDPTMVKCDICGIWQHGTKDSLQGFFMCTVCCDTVIGEQSSS